jgi:hypothetical protein
MSGTTNAITDRDIPVFAGFHTPKDDTRVPTVLDNCCLARWGKGKYCMSQLIHNEAKERQVYEQTSKFEHLATMAGLTLANKSGIVPKTIPRR